MRIEIYLEWEKVGETQDIKPHTSFTIDVQKNELKYLTKKHKQLFQSISDLIKFNIQFME